MRWIACCLTLIAAHLFATMVQAEVHAVSLTGLPPSEVLPEVRVELNRPGRFSTLALSSDQPVRWLVETRPDSKVAAFVLHGSGADQSAVVLDGTEVSYVARVQQIPTTHGVESGDFDRFKTALFDVLTGVRLHSVSVANRTDVDHLIGEVTSLAEAPQLGLDPLKGLADPDALPEALSAPFLDQMRGVRPLSSVTMDNKGMRVTEVDGSTRDFPLEADTFREGRPIALHRAGDQVFGVTRGRSGALYQLDLAVGQWEKLLTIGSSEVTGLLADPKTRRIILTAGQVSRRSSLRIAVYDMDNRTFRVVNFVPNARETLAALHGRAQGMQDIIQPIAIAGDQLLLKLGKRDENRRSVLYAEGSFRMFVFDLETEIATLVGYRNAPHAD